MLIICILLGIGLLVMIVYWIATFYNLKKKVSKSGYTVGVITGRTDVPDFTISGLTLEEATMIVNQANEDINTGNTVVHIHLDTKPIDYMIDSFLVKAVYIKH